MSIEIKEYIGNNMSIVESSTKMFMELKEGYNSVDPINKDSIMQDIAGIHVGPTRNFTWYTEEALDSSIPSWTKPYQRPLIMHHNEKDGKIIGRVVHAEKQSLNTRSGTPALIFTCNVPDKDGKEQILDGRLKTVSIGVIAHDVRCSICNKQVELDETGYPDCGHMRGNLYKNEVCYWMIYKMEAKELSYVIVPSDIYAHNLRTYSPDKKDIDIDIEESIDLKEGVLKTMTINKDIDKNKIEAKEGQSIDEVVKEGSKVAEKEVEEVKEVELERVKKELEKAESEKIAYIKELDEIKISLTDATAKVDKAVKELAAEVELKESAENQLIAIKTELRESAEDNLNSLRVVLNKPIMTKETLEIRSFESIKDSIVDLKEEMKVKGLESVKHISEAVDPTIGDKDKKEKNKEKAKLNVKESNSNGNIDLEQGVKDLMAKFLM